MEKRTITFLFLAAIGLLFSMTKANAQPGTFPKIKAAFPPYTDCAQLFVGIEKGYFHEEGLEVEPVRITEGRSILQSLKNGENHLGFANLVSLVASRNDGYDLVAIAGGPVEDTGHVENGIFVRKHSGIQKPADLAGKKVAVNVRKNIIELITLEYLERQNINLSTIEIVEKPFPDMLQSLLNGEVDAAPLIVPFKSMAEKNKDVRLLAHYVMDLFPRFESSSYLVTKKWADANQSSVAKIQRAMKKATDFCRQHPEEVKEIISKYVPFSNEQMNQAVLPSFDYSISEDGLESIIQMMYKRGWITRAFPARSLIY
jgi:NitT/TauT family transport system substrate-binding protein